jgi:hypothetical protein
VIPLEALPINKQYKAISKIIPLNVWLWVSLNWWLGDKGEHRHQEKHTWSLDSVKGKLTAAKRGLDARMCNRFMLYLKLEIGIKDEKWMSLVF